MFMLLLHEQGDMRPRRQCAAYHIERSIAISEGLTQYPCACRLCCGARTRRFDTIARHHRKNGRDPFLPYPVIVSWFHIRSCLQSLCYRLLMFEHIAHVGY